MLVKRSGESFCLQLSSAHRKTSQCLLTEKGSIYIYIIYIYIYIYTHTHTHTHTYNIFFSQVDKDFKKIRLCIKPTHFEVNQKVTNFDLILSIWKLEGGYIFYEWMNYSSNEALQIRNKMFIINQKTIYWNFIRFTLVLLFLCNSQCFNVGDNLC